METLEVIDRSIFLYFNGLHCSWLDPIMYYATQKWTWIPLYCWFLLLIQKKYRWSGVLIAIVTVALMITIVDQTTNVFKYGFERYRPCNNFEIQSQVHLVYGYCSGTYSFFSGHASNTFAIACFMAVLLYKKYKFVVIWLIMWALFVSYTRIYLGVHYPSDVFCGALFGSVVGIITGILFKKADFKIKSKV